MNLIKYVLQVVSFLCLAICSDCKIYSNCEFVNALMHQGVVNSSLWGTWTCLAYHLSKFNTKTINEVTSAYGILQISSQYWCSDDGDTPGKGCVITCKSLLDDDIRGDIKCAKAAFTEAEQRTRNGFDAWGATYKQYCLGDQSQWIWRCKFYDSWNVVLSRGEAIQISFLSNSFVFVIVMLVLHRFGLV